MSLGALSTLYDFHYAAINICQCRLVLSSLTLFRVTLPQIDFAQYLLDEIGGAKFDISEKCMVYVIKTIYVNRLNMAEMCLNRRDAVNISSISAQFSPTNISLTRFMHVIRYMFYACEYMVIRIPSGTQLTFAKMLENSSKLFRNCWHFMRLFVCSSCFVDIAATHHLYYRCCRLGDLARMVKEE